VNQVSTTILSSLFHPQTRIKSSPLNLYHQDTWDTNKSVACNCLFMFNSWSSQAWIIWCMNNNYILIKEISYLRWPSRPPGTINILSLYHNISFKALKLKKHLQFTDIFKLFIYQMSFSTNRDIVIYQYSNYFLSSYPIKM